jgi:hypothetical protein
MKTDELERGWSDAAREELRRLVAEGRAPSEVPAHEFGPWGEHVKRLRAAHAQGVGAVREQFLVLAGLHPELGRLLSGQEEVRTRVWSTAELLAAELPPLRWAVPELLPFGSATLVGRIGVGKTALALQMATAVVSGGRMLGRPVEQGKVLYLAIDHDEGWLRKWLAPFAGVRWHDLHLACTWPSLARDGVERLAAAIDDEGYRLVIVDTLAGVSWDETPLYPARRPAVLRDLHQVAQALDVAIVAIDQYHARLKGGHGGPVWEMIDNLGEAGTVDTVIAMHRGPGKRTTRLAVVGSDLEDLDLEMVWDAGTRCWGLVG